MDEIELKSDEYQETFGYTPPWILRCGIALILFIIISSLVAASIIKYPDIISSDVILTGLTPPVRIKSGTSGRLIKIYVLDKQTVCTGDYLAIIENTVNEKDIKYLKSYLKDLNQGPKDKLILPDKDLKLGNLQASYSSFYQVLYDYIEFKKNNYPKRKNQIIKNRILYNRNYYTNLKKQKDAVNQQAKLIHIQFERDSLLYKKGILSQQDLEEAQKQYLESHISIETIDGTLNSAQINHTEMQETLVDNESSSIEKENYYKVQLENTKTQLLAEIQLWELSYVLISPINGKVSFNNFWSENQNVISGEEIFHILPSDSGKIIGKAYLPIARSGKVKRGQKVNLHLDNFPDNEFGIVKGFIKDISLVPSLIDNANYYVVGIELPLGLETSYNKVLPYYPDMKGQADIITEDLSFLQRILLPLKDLYSNKVK